MPNCETFGLNCRLHDNDRLVAVVVVVVVVVVVAVVFVVGLDVAYVAVEKSLAVVIRCWCRR